MKSVLYQQYKKEIMPALKKEFGYKNVMQVPKLEKVVINVGYGKHAKEKNYVEHVEKVLSAISGINPKAFDHQGNYTVGIKEQLAFPEITSSMVDIIHGLEITFVIKGGNKEQNFSLLSKMGFPFRNK